MRSITLAIAALLLLASCSDDPEPIEPTASPSASSTPVEPKMPETARDDTPSGAANFVTFWVSTFNYGAQTGEVEPMLSHARDCRPCEGYANDFEQLATSKRAKEPVWRLSNISVSADRDPIEVEADVDIANEEDPSTLVFVLNDQAPFEVTDIFKSKS